MSASTQRLLVALELIAKALTKYNAGHWFDGSCQTCGSGIVSYRYDKVDLHTSPPRFPMFRCWTCRAEWRGDFCP